MRKVQGMTGNRVVGEDFMVRAFGRGMRQFRFDEIFANFFAEFGDFELVLGDQSSVSRLNRLDFFAFTFSLLHQLFFLVEISLGVP